MESAVDWHYKIFNCPNTVDANVATFDSETDEMAQWLADKGENWYVDAIEDMKSWDVKTAPMGDRYDPVGEGNSPIGWSGDAHGLITYTTFDLTAEQMGWVAQADLNDIYMNIWYDNTLYLYINGTLVFSHDNEGASGDWNDAQTAVDFAEDVDIREILKEGENTVVASLKDGWGGREFIMSLECVY